MNQTWGGLRLINRPPLNRTAAALLRPTGRGGNLRLVRPQIRAVRIRLHQPPRLPDDLELTVLLDLADQHRLERVLVFLIHLLLSTPRIELPPLNPRAHPIHIEAP